MDQLWDIINSPLVSIAWKFASLLGYFLAGFAVWLLKRHLDQNEETLKVVQESQSDIRVLMESKQDHGHRIGLLESRMWEEATNRRGRK